MTAMAYSTPVWWGRSDLELNQSRGWLMAGLNLVATRSQREWRFQTRRSPTQHEDQQEWSQQDTALPEDASASRHFFKQTTPALYLLPRLADRSVVAKPVNAIYIPGGEEVTLYVSTPVWVACYAEEREAPLLDIPVVRPSDTWFGRSTIQGEVAYATQVLGRTDLAQFPPRPFRAVTPITIRNNGSATLPLERINIPVPYLPVYAAENGRLWTPSLHVLKEPGSNPPRIRIEPTISALAGSVELLTPARISTSDHTLIRIFDNFF